MSKKSLQSTLMIFSATISAVLIALALSNRVSPFNLLLFTALCLTVLGILIITGARQAPLGYGIDSDPGRPWEAMLTSRGRGRRRS